MVKPRWEVKIGSPITATDGDYGRLQQLLVDPGQERVVGLLVRPHGWLPYHLVVVPENVIAEASENEVRLNINREQLEAQPKYLPDAELVMDGRSYEVDDKWSPVGGEQIEVGRAANSEAGGMISNQFTRPEPHHQGLLVQVGQRVFCGEEPAGWVALLLLEPGGRVTGFVLHTGPLIGRNLIVPITWIHQVDGNRVYLSIGKKDLQGLHDYRLDDALALEVKHALWSDEILRNTDYKEISISVEDGVVKLRGHVVTQRNIRNAEAAARSVPGVLGLENDLVVDDDLVLEVAQALGKNELTRSERIAIGAQNGFVTLNGYVANAAIRNDAEAIAASIPQVRAVVNYLQAPNVIIDYKDEPIWQPYIGQEVSAADMQLGQVERVVIDPRNRRVTAFIARGYFPDPQDKDGYRLPSDEPQEESSVVIPMDAVGSVTDGSVLLKVRGAEAALYHSFELTDFIDPPAEWQPPYPYRWEQVFFERQGLEDPKSDNSPA